MRQYRSAPRRQKNIRSLDGEAEPMTIHQMRKLPDPVPGFKVGNTREKIQALGEGKKIGVVANAIAVRKGSKESCNRGLSTVADTDKHIVQVNPVLRKKPGETPKALLHRREVNLITAEFSPRVTPNNPHLVRTNLAPLIAFNGVSKVREYCFSTPSIRWATICSELIIWEIHTILALDYCLRGSDARQTMMIIG